MVRAVGAAVRRLTIHATGAATGIPSRHTTGKCGPDRPALLAQLDITLADGTVRTVATDGAWRSGIGPERGSDLYDGETYDARLELGGRTRAAASGTPRRW